jgi:tRNA(Ile)-lysidine synthase
VPLTDAASTDAAAIDPAAFAALMAPFEPFEPAPWLAVGVSGGADSTALCLLADAWARRRGGRVTGLIVDHRLRPESSAEAQHTAKTLRDRGIAAEILERQGPAPMNRIQERARASRFALLIGWCRREGVLHLLLGHHRRDQLETATMQGARPGGQATAAGMAPIVDTPAVRILRPLLTVDPARLRSTLAHGGVAWIEDPSNRDTRFERVRVRQALAASGEVGDADVLRAAERSRRNAAAEAAAAALLARTASVHPAGFAWLAAGFAVRASAEVAGLALSALLTMVGGREHHPKQAAVNRLIADLGGDGAGATLHGCRIVGCGDRLLICRELREAPPPLALRPGRWGWWDGRFLATITGQTPGRPLRIDALGVAGGAAGWRTVMNEAGDAGRRAVPALRP